jgi:membrane protein
VPETPGSTRPRRSGRLAWTGIWPIARRTAAGFVERQMSDRAAALTYYGMLSLFPLLIAVVALAGVFGRHPETTDALLGVIESFGSPALVETVRQPLQSVIENRGGAGALLGIGLLGALWSASGYISAFARASNAIWDVEEGRPVWRLKPLQILLTVGMVVALLLLATVLAVSGPVAREIGESIGFGDEAILAWELGKWPVLLLLVVALVTGLYWSTPNVRPPSPLWLSPGAVVAVALLGTATALFSVYLANFGSYNAVYGGLATAIVLLIWLWLANASLLIGALLDAEIERHRQLAALQPGADRELQLPARERAD